MKEFIIGTLVVASLFAIYMFFCYLFGYYYIKLLGYWDKEMELFDFNSINDCITVGVFRFSLLILFILFLLVIIIPIKQLGNYIINLL